MFLVWICCGIAAAMVASSKGRVPGRWFLLGLAIGPFALIFALLASKEGPGEGEKKCPFCAEYVKNEAIVCKHCGKDLHGGVLSHDSGDTIPCLQCGHENSIRAFKCDNCGHFFRD